MTDGFILIDKPPGPTSHDVVAIVRRLFRARLPFSFRSGREKSRVGHAGTLDPFASGLLIIGFGRATKKLGIFQGLDKKYQASIQLGATSDTYDRTGRLTKTITDPKKLGITENQVRQTLNQFIGPLEQIPPMYSAKKVRGQKLYELARRGIEVERKPVRMMIYQIKLLEFEGAKFKIQVHCSSGAYLRALAHDLGQTLGGGAYLQELRRTAIGPFQIEEAIPLARLKAENFEQNLCPVDSFLTRVISSKKNL